MCNIEKKIITTYSQYMPHPHPSHKITAFYTEMGKINETDMSHLWNSAASKRDSALPQPETHSRE